MDWNKLIMNILGELIIVVAKYVFAQIEIWAKEYFEKQGKKPTSEEKRLAFKEKWLVVTKGNTPLESVEDHKLNLAIELAHLDNISASMQESPIVY